MLKAGDVMSGALSLNADPTLPQHASTKRYTDTMLPLAGGTMTGLVTLSGAPSSALHAATKAYSDLKLPLAGGTLTSPGTIAGVAGLPSRRMTRWDRRPHCCRI